MNPELAARDREALDRALESLAAGGEDLAVAPLADLSRAATGRLRQVWPALPDELRRRIVSAIVDDLEQQVERGYTRVLTVAIDDALPEVRRSAWDALWEADSAEVLDLLLERVASESDAGVRAAMAEALGTFAARAELGELDDMRAGVVRERLVELMANDDSSEVRRRALESAGYLSGDPQVIRSVGAAFGSGDDELRISALRAMGRQADERWRADISGELGNPDPEMRYEAVQAAGVSEDQAFVPAIIDLIDDEDLEVQLAAITALGAIGGQTAVRVLRRLVSADSPAIAEAAQDALDAALLSVGSIHGAQALNLDRSSEEA